MARNDHYAFPGAQKISHAFPWCKGDRLRLFESFCDQVIEAGFARPGKE